MNIRKIGRNDPCWCGSKMKYKSCHLAFDQKIGGYRDQGKEVPSRQMIKTPAQIEGIRKAGHANSQILDMVDQMMRPGISTEEINQLVHKATCSLGGIPATLNYNHFPKSVCTSVNEVVCHGIPSPDRILKEGDIVNVDATTILGGYYGDASRMYCIGKVSQEAKRLVQVAKECLDLGLAQAKPWGCLGDVGEAVSSHAYENGYTVVREIGGHGVGLAFHEDPWVSHIGKKGTGILLVPGMVFTIEPMVNAGREEVVHDQADGWTVSTEDGSLSAQWEYTVLITEEGNEVLSY